MLLELEVSLEKLGTARGQLGKTGAPLSSSCSGFPSSLRCAKSSCARTTCSLVRGCPSFSLARPPIRIVFASQTSRNSPTKRYIHTTGITETVFVSTYKYIPSPAKSHSTGECQRRIPALETRAFAGNQLFDRFPSWHSPFLRYLAVLTLPHGLPTARLALRH